MNGHTIDLVHSHTPRVSAIATQEPDNDPLDLNPSGLNNDRLKLRVRRLKPDLITILIKPLECHTLAIDERHNHLTLSRLLARFHDHEVAVLNVIPYHRLALHPQNIVGATPG
jgi:hypothetical protein